jgi:hypothetical protein
MDNTPKPASGQRGADDLLAKAESMVSDFADRMAEAGFTRLQSLDAIEQASAALRHTVAEDTEPADNGRSLEATDALDEPSNDWPAQ